MDRRRNSRLHRRRQPGGRTTQDLPPARSSQTPLPFQHGEEGEGRGTEQRPDRSRVGRRRGKRKMAEKIIRQVGNEGGASLRWKERAPSFPQREGAGCPPPRVEKSCWLASRRPRRLQAWPRGTVSPFFLLQSPLCSESVEGDPPHQPQSRPCRESATWVWRSSVQLYVAQPVAGGNRFDIVDAE